VPTVHTTIDLSGNALNEASVNAILARCVASESFTAGTVNLAGGTIAAQVQRLEAAVLREHGYRLQGHPKAKPETPPRGKRVAASPRQGISLHYCSRRAYSRNQQGS
jgi:hypothetical protein